MPIYDYKCGKCGGELADWPVSHDEMDQVPCPECGETMQRQMALPAAPDAVGSYQHGAILSNGQRVAGHFGASARKRGRRD